MPIETIMRLTVNSITRNPVHVRMMMSWFDVICGWESTLSNSVTGVTAAETAIYIIENIIACYKRWFSLP